MHVPVTSSPYNKTIMSFGMRPLAIRWTWPNHRKRPWLSSEYMLKQKARSKLYKVTSKECNKAVVIAKEEAYAELYKKLDTAEGNKIIYKLANTRNRRSKDICDNIVINDKRRKDSNRHNKDHRRMERAVCRALLEWTTRLDTSSRTLYWNVPSPPLPSPPLPPLPPSPPSLPPPPSLP